MKTRNVILLIVSVLLITVLIMGRSSIGNLLKGQVHFPEEYIGEVLTMEDGQRFTVFRRLRVDGNEYCRGTPAIFKVRFRFKNLSTGANKRLSIIPAPFLVGRTASLAADRRPRRKWSCRSAAPQWHFGYRGQVVTLSVGRNRSRRRCHGATDMGPSRQQLRLRRRPVCSRSRCQ